MRSDLLKRRRSLGTAHCTGSAEGLALGVGSVAAAGRVGVPPEGADAVPAAAAVRRGRMRIALIAGAVAVLLAGTAAVVLIQRSGNDDQGAGGTTTSQSATPSSSAASRSSAASSAASSSALSTATATVSAIGTVSPEQLAGAGYRDHLVDAMRGLPGHPLWLERLDAERTVP
jgi:hypothetical protein